MLEIVIGSKANWYKSTMWFIILKVTNIGNKDFYLKNDVVYEWGCIHEH